MLTGVTEEYQMKETGNRRNRDSFRKNAAFLIFLVFVSVIRIWLAVGTPVYIVYAVQDDQLLMKHSAAMLQFEWLGEYTENTLTKGTAFPLYILFSCFSRIPYTVLTALFWIFADGLMTFSLKDIVRNRVILALMYVLLLFAPVTSSLSSFQRLYRNSVAAPAALLCAACSIYLFLNIEKRKALSVFTSLILGFDLWFVMNLREDGIWLLPLPIAAAILTVIRLILKKQENKRMIYKACVFLIIPWIMLAAGNLTISLLNYHTFGVFIRNDRTQGAFEKTTNLFISAECPDDDSDERTVWVSRKKYDMMIRESPTLSSIAPELLRGYEKYSSAWNMDGECNGDFYVWALREGAMYAGIYSTAAGAEEFWEKAYKELNEAFDTGRLKKRKALFLSFSSRGITVQNIKEIPELVTDCMLANVLYYSEQAAEFPAESTGGVHYIRSVESMTGSYAIYPDEYIENDPARIIGHRMIRLNNFITGIYRRIAGPIFFGGKAAFLFLLAYWIIMTVRRKQTFLTGASLLIAAGLFLTATLLQFAVSWFCVFMGDQPLNQWWFYGGQAVPFYMSADLLMLGMAFTVVKTWVDETIKKRKR